MLHRSRRPAAVSSLMALALVAGLLPVAAVSAFSAPSPAAWINEIHYDNAGTDTGEAIEIAGVAGTDLTGWALHLINGASGVGYNNEPLTGTIPDQDSGFGTVVLTLPSNGIQNGSPDGIALYDGTAVVQFLSYEGAFTGTGLPVVGLLSTDIGVSEDGSEPIGGSLGLVGTGTTYADFSWAPSAPSSFGEINPGQAFGTDPGDAAPTVASTTPADDAIGIDADASIEVTFSEPVDVTGSWFSIACATTGGHTAAVSGGPTTYTLDPDIDFGEGEVCTVTVGAASVTDVDTVDPPDTMADDASFSFETATPIIVSDDVTISQVYGGGGNSGALYRNDFIELFNRGTTDVAVDGWSVQYASAAGSSWQVTPLADAVPAGKHYLIQEAAGAGGTLFLPDPDATGTIAMAAGAGKVALVASTTALTGVCPTRSDILDLVGYGTTASCFEGSGRAPQLSNTTAALRHGDGAVDTDDNAADFAVGDPNPRAAHDSAPRVASSFPSSGANGVPTWANLTITFSEPVDVTGSWFSISCATSGIHPATASGGPGAFRLDPTTDFTGGETCTVTIAAAHVSDQDQDDPPDTMAADHVFRFTVAADVTCGDPATFIHQVQGSGLASPITGQVVEIEGVVVGAYPGPIGFFGLHVQEEDADQDGDPATSDGVFIFEPNGGATYAVGDLVRIRGTVSEFTTSGVTLTELGNLSNLVVCDTGETVTPAGVTLPFSSSTFAERYEGMLVDIDQELFVTETFTLGRFGEVVLSSGDRLITPTNVVEPGAPAIARQAENDRNRIVLDDGDNRQNLDPTLYPQGGLSAFDTLRIGDTTQGGTFVFEQRFGTYRLQPTATVPTFQPTNPRPTTPDDVGGSLKVASMNVLNFFTTLDTNPGSGNGPDICGPGASLECRGASTAFEFDRQRAKILSALIGLDADVVGLMEIENNDEASVASLVDGLNEILGAGTYAFINTRTIGTDAIKVAFIYQPAAAKPVGDHAILDSSVDPRFIDTLNRPALAQTFESTATGGRMTVVVNHLKSKGSACAGDPDTGDGQGNCNRTRVAAAEALVDWIASDPTGSGDRDALVIGDLNAYAKEDPIDVFEAAGYTNMIHEFLGDEAYSFVFTGQSGYLDHALASPTLAAQVSGTTEWHINADEPIVLDYNTDFKSDQHVKTLFAPHAYRSSDHDPVLVGLALLDYDFGGFEPPVSETGVTTLKAGQSLPVKFSLGGNHGLDVLFGVPSFQRTHCSTGAPIGAPITAVTTEPFSYDAGNDTYEFVWKTQKSWATWCGTLEVPLADGTALDLAVRFK